MAAILDITRGSHDRICLVFDDFFFWQLNRATQWLLWSSEVVSAAGVFLVAVDLSGKGFCIMIECQWNPSPGCFNAVYNLSNQASPFHSRRTSVNHQLRFILWRPQIALHSVGARPIFEERIRTTSQHFCPRGKLLARCTRRSRPPTLPHSRRSFWIYWIRFRDFHNWLISASSPPW